MKLLILSFLKIFFRNKRAIFFVIGLPAAIFLILATFGVEQVLDFDLPLSYTDFLLPGIIAYALTQTGIYTVAYTVIDYKRLNILKRLSVTPLPAGKFLQAQSVARFLVALLQAGILLLLGAGLFNAKFGIQIVLLPLIILIGSIIFLNFGYFIASLARDYEEAAPYTTIVGLTMGFLGDVFFPIDNLPAFLQQIAAFLPLKPLTGAMRYAMYGLGPENFVSNITILIVWLASSFYIAKTIFEKKAYMKITKFGHLDV